MESEITTLTKDLERGEDSQGNSLPKLKILENPLMYVAIGYAIEKALEACAQQMRI